MTTHEINQVCYRTLNQETPWSLETYKRLGGYSSLERILKQKEFSPGDLVELLKSSGLRGRGGAGFPTGLKMSFLKRDLPIQKYILSNCDESEPGTCKDVQILLNNPHQLIEGMIIAGYIIGATVGYNFIRGEFWAPFNRMETALEEARAQGYIGKDIFGSGFDFELHNHIGAGAYICGEETALMNALEGRKGLPRVKPPFPAVRGLYDKPTNINNTETIASIPVIIEKGPEWFASQGVGKSGGTKIFCVSGHVNKPGNFEIGMGTPFSELLDMAGGMLDGKQLKAVIPGGSSMPVLPADIIMKTNLDYESLMEAGSMIGSGAVMVMDENTCMVEALTRLMKFYKHESCGQCTPCREGTSWTYKLTKKILSGKGTLDDLDRLARVVDGIEGRTICVFGEAVSWPVKGFLRHFRSEFEHIIKHGKSIVLSRNEL